MTKVLHGPRILLLSLKCFVAHEVEESESLCTQCLLRFPCLRFFTAFHGLQHKGGPCRTFVLEKANVSHSLIAVGAVGVRVPLYLGHSK